MSLKTKGNNPLGEFSPGAQQTKLTQREKLIKLAKLENGVILLGAVATAIGYTALPLACPLLILLLPACLFWLARSSRSGRQAFKHGWYTGLWGLSASLYWLTVPMTTVGQMPLVLAIPCVLLLGSFLGLYTGLACFCFRGLIRFFASYRSGNSPSPSAALMKEEFHGARSHTTSASQEPLSPESPLPLPASFSRRILLLVFAGLCYGGIELISAHILTGFPWLSLPVALAGLPLLIQPVNLVGAYGYSALLTFLALSPFMLKAGPATGPRTEASGPNQSQLWPSLGIAFCAMALLASLAFYSYRSFYRPITGESIQVGVVQTNIDQNQKWDPVVQSTTVEKHLALSRQIMEGSDSPLNLLLWAETAMPFFYQQGEPYRSQLHDFAIQHDVNIAFGTLGFTTRPSRRPQHFNRLQLVSHKGQPAGHYDKEHLVPFGEYNPIPFYISFLENILQGIDFAAGFDQPLLLLPDNGKTAPQKRQHWQSTRNEAGKNTGTGSDTGTGTSLGQQASHNRNGANAQNISRDPSQRDNPKGNNGIPAQQNGPSNTTGLNGYGQAGLNGQSGQTGHNGQAEYNRQTGHNGYSEQEPNDAEHKTSSGTLVTPQQRFEEKFGISPFAQEPLARLGSLICYEVIFPALAQERVSQGADLLITISNDSWFGKTAAPQQHLNHAVLRAVEQGRSMVRSTSSGYSALILPNGEVHHKSALYTEAAYAFAAPLATRITIYHSLHLGIDLFLLLGLSISIGFGLKFRNL